MRAPSKCRSSIFKSLLLKKRFNIWITFNIIFNYIYNNRHKHTEFAFFYIFLEWLRARIPRVPVYVGSRMHAVDCIQNDDGAKCKLILNKMSLSVDFRCGCMQLKFSFMFFFFLCFEHILTKLCWFYEHFLVSNNTNRMHQSKTIHALTSAAAEHLLSMRSYVALHVCVTCSDLKQIYNNEKSVGKSDPYGAPTNLWYFFFLNTSSFVPNKILECIARNTKLNGI